MHTVKPVTMITGLLTGYIIAQLIIDTGINPGLKATLIMFTIPPALALVGWAVGKLIDKKRQRPKQS